MKKRIFLMSAILTFFISTVTVVALAQDRAIIHDGEYNFLKAQYELEWAQQDKQIDVRLAEIRERQGGKRPNILYILVDDVGFGDFGIPELNYVRGTQTPRINKLADEGLSLMRMYTEPSCTPTRTAMMTGRHPVRTGLKEVKVALVGEGLPASEVTIAEVLSEAGYNEMNQRYQDQTLEQLRSLSKKKEPFFLQYWPLIPINLVRSDREQFKTINGGTMGESMQQLDGWVGDILDELDDLGIADNTLVVLMGDNGPFLFGYEKTMGMNDMIYRGGKGDHLEGGVRVNAFARWPAAIKPDSLAGDMIHVSDLYTTFARLAGATKYIPTDRIIDGVDQTSLLLEGEGNAVSIFESWH